MIEEIDWQGTVLDVPTAWNGLERYIKPVMEHYNVKNDLALEFGVDSGYSLHIFSQIFKKVIGVDSFQGDIHIGHEQGDEFYNRTLKRFENTNAEIIRKNYKDFIKDNNNTYDLIHIDIVHLYDETYECAEWSIQHSNIVLMHDISAFFDVHRVCEDLARKHNLTYNNTINKYHGLGILYRS